MIENGNKVSVHYTGKLENGEVFDSSVNGEPIEFIVGSGQIIPGFEKAIIGKEINERMSIQITPDEAYGEYRDDLVVNVPNANLPGHVDVGTILQAQAENGMPINVKVKEVLEDHVVVDANHPLAGKTLYFDIEIVKID